MSGLLNLIVCWLNDFFFSVNDFIVNIYDSMLLAVDAFLLSLPAITISSIDPAYTWVLGATGISQSLAIIGGALLTRFLLQSVPFVRWGS
jgi:hypothetical protein